MDSLIAALKGLLIGSVGFAILYFLFWLREQARIRARLLELELQDEKQRVSDEIDNLPLDDLVHRSNSKFKIRKPGSDFSD